MLPSLFFLHEILHSKIYFRLLCIPILKCKNLKINDNIFFGRYIKLKVTHGPHETQSKVLRATLKKMKKKIFWILRSIEKISQMAFYFFKNLDFSWRWRAACLRPLFYGMHIFYYLYNCVERRRQNFVFITSVLLFSNEVFFCIIINRIL